jgi:hypothetical protein
MELYAEIIYAIRNTEKKYFLTTMYMLGNDVLQVIFADNEIKK